MATTSSESPLHVPFCTFPAWGSWGDRTPHRFRRKERRHQRLGAEVPEPRHGMHFAWGNHLLGAP